jgi:hypothetical protein
MDFLVAGTKSPVIYIVPAPTGTSSPRGTIVGDHYFEALVVKLCRLAMNDDESDNVSDSDSEIQEFAAVTSQYHSRKLLSRY